MLPTRREKQSARRVISPGDPLPIGGTGIPTVSLTEDSNSFAQSARITYQRASYFGRAVGLWHELELPTHPTNVESLRDCVAKVLNWRVTNLPPKDSKPEPLWVPENSIRAGFAQ
jgi:hypothetical protein